MRDSSGLSLTASRAPLVGRFASLRFGKTAWARLVVMIALCVMTFLLFLIPIRYETIASQLVPSVFAGRWQAAGERVAVLAYDPSVALLRAEGGEKGVPLIYHRVPLNAKFTHIRVAAQLRANAIVGGPQNWQQARLLVRSYDAEGVRLRHLPFEAAALSGSTGWIDAELEVPITPDVLWMRVLIYNGGDAGTLLVRGLRVDGLVETTIFRVLRWGLIGLWALAGLWCLIPLLHRPRLTLAPTVVGLVCAAIFAGTLLPQPFLANATAPVIEQLERGVMGPVRALINGDIAMPPPPGEDSANFSGVATAHPGAGGLPAPGAGGDMAATPESDGGGTHAGDALLATRPLSEIGSGGPGRLFVQWANRLDMGPLAHLFAFIVLGLVAPFGFSRVRPAQLFVYLLVLSAVTESLQAFYDSRTPELEDLAMNSLGVALGMGLAITVRQLRARRQYRSRT